MNGYSLIYCGLAFIAHCFLAVWLASGPLRRFLGKAYPTKRTGEHDPDLALAAQPGQWRGALMGSLALTISFTICVLAITYVMAACELDIWRVPKFAQGSLLPAPLKLTEQKLNEIGLRGANRIQAAIHQVGSAKGSCDLILRVFLGHRDSATIDDNVRKSLEKYMYLELQGNDALSAFCSLMVELSDNPQPQSAILLRTFIKTNSITFRSVSLPSYEQLCCIWASNPGVSNSPLSDLAVTIAESLKAGGTSRYVLANSIYDSIRQAMGRHNRIRSMLYDKNTFIQSITFFLFFFGLLLLRQRHLRLAQQRSYNDRFLAFVWQGLRSANTRTLRLGQLKHRLGPLREAYLDEHGLFQTLSRADFTDLPAFASRLAVQDDAISRYLRNRLSTDIRECLLKSANSAPGEEFQANMVKDLAGRILQIPESIYERRRFRGVTLSHETRNLLETSPQGEAVVLLNRLLLKDAYPDLMSREMENRLGYCIWNFNREDFTFENLSNEKEILNDYKRYVDQAPEGLKDAPKSGAKTMSPSTTVKKKSTAHLFGIGILSRVLSELANALQSTGPKTVDDQASAVQAGRQLLSETVERSESRLERVEYAAVDYIIYGMPSFGFIGTVVGIAFALGAADSVVRASNPEAQAAAIGFVTGWLGVAFDTTLVALVCSIIIMLLLQRTRSKESSFLLDVQRSISTRILEHWD